MEKRLKCVDCKGNGELILMYEKIQVPVCHKCKQRVMMNMDVAIDEGDFTHVIQKYNLSTK